MIWTLLVLLVLATFLLIIVAMLEDLDQLIAEAEAECAGCQRHFVIPGCPLHDPERRRNGEETQPTRERTSSVGY